MAKVLFVDDFEGLLKSLQEVGVIQALNEAGHEVIVEVTTSVIEGLAAVERHQPDVLMCDGIMGDGVKADDAEAGKKIVAILKNSGFPVVIIAFTAMNIGADYRFPAKIPEKREQTDALVALIARALSER